MKEHRLYRGQGKYETIIPSALRPDCIKYMENEISQLGININEYKKLSIPKYILQQYNQCDKDSFYAYWLSLVNCAIIINKNPMCLKFCQSPFFTKNADADKVGIYGISNDRIAQECYNYAGFFFNSCDETETIRLQYILHDYAFFQHFNHVLSRVDKTAKYKVLFPTLALDWTWDYSIADKFSGKNGHIISISYEAYKEWNPTKHWSLANTPTKEIKDLIFGLCTYRDTVSWDDDKLDWDSWDNTLMIEQQGAVIFWPWKNTFDELLVNTLGKALDFRVDR